MKKLFFLIGLLLVGTIVYSQIEINQSVPFMELKTLNGEIINTASVNEQGQPVIMVFWASWSEPSIKLLDEIQEQYSKYYYGLGIKVIAISVDDSRSIHKIPKIIRSHGWTFDILLDTKSVFKNAMKVGSNPVTFLINKNGTIVSSHSGYYSGEINERLASEIQNLISINQVAAQTDSDINIINNYYQEKFVTATGNLIKRYEELLLSNQSKQKQLHRNIDSFNSRSQPVKGEFEKVADYKKRLTEYNKNASIVEKEVSSLMDYENQEDTLSRRITSLIKYKTSFIKPQILSEKLEDISVYDSENESFQVIFKGDKYLVNIPIVVAPSFKQLYNILEIYRFPDEAYRFVFIKGVYTLVE